MNTKSALITGITGQDGSYLAELLLSKGYKVIGMISSVNDIGLQNILDIKDQLITEEGDLLDQKSIANLIKKYQPNEIYNLGGITFIPKSWQNPSLTYNVNTLGLARILEAVRDFSPKTKVFQATSSRIFGNQGKKVADNLIIQSENTPFEPLDPYAVSKLAAHYLTKQFVEHFDIFACSGILYNHESEKRGPEFVTRKIIQGAVKIKLGTENKLFLGNLDAKADWGYAPDYVQAMWQMLQLKTPENFILATGEVHSVRDICKIAFDKLDLDYQKYVEIDPKFYRKSELANYGDSRKAVEKLAWKRSVSFKQMIEKMVDYDLELLKK